MPKALLFLCLLAVMPAWSQPVPARIVSMNLCSDLLLLNLVESTRIASLSALAADPDYSPLARQADGIPSNRAQADEVMQYQPDLILTSIFSAGQAATILQRLGYHVEALDLPANLEQVYQVIEQVGLLTGTEARAMQQTRAMQQSLAGFTDRLTSHTSGKTAVFFSGNGYSYGSETLQDAFIASLGMQNLAASAGLPGPAQLSIEALVAGKPDYIFVNSPRASDRQLALPMLEHPAYLALANTSRIIQLEESWFQCGDQRLLQAYEKLAEELLQ